MKFIDEAIIHAKAGKGGAGSKSFRREAMVPLGGPDGGNGGHGGSVIIVATRNKQTLLDFSFQPEWKATDGAGGEGNNRTGKSGEDLKILVPVGTEVYNVETDELVVDLSEDAQEFTLCKGGRGGKGNDFFKTSTNRAPEHAQPGEQGEEGKFKLLLKLVADVGLIGLPNAGKSTLISRISSARPKIADYPFTTLTPNLGVVKSKSGRTFVVADIPGLIPGASEGKGLGIQFLKHIERTRVLVHLLDATVLLEEDGEAKLLQNFDDISIELANYSDNLSGRQELIVLTKIDALPDRGILEKIQPLLAEKGSHVHAISSVSGVGIESLVEKLASIL